MSMLATISFIGEHVAQSKLFVGRILVSHRLSGPFI